MLITTRRRGRTGSRESAAVAAKLFRGFGDPMRLAILRLLAGGERRVVDIVAEVGTSQPNISGHLACLKDCGLIADRPVGRQVFYRIAVPEVFDLLREAERVLAKVGHSSSSAPATR